MQKLEPYTADEIQTFLKKSLYSGRTKVNPQFEFVE